MALINRPRTKGGNAHSGSSIHQKDNRNKVNTAHSLSAQQPTWKNKACKYFVSKLKFKSSLFRVSFSVTEERTAHEAAECKQRKELNGGNVFRTTNLFDVQALAIQHLISLTCYIKDRVIKTQYISYFSPHILLVVSVEMVQYLSNVILWLKMNQKLICLPFSMLFREER